MLWNNEHATFPHNPSSIYLFMDRHCMSCICMFYFGHFVSLNACNEAWYFDSLRCYNPIGLFAVFGCCTMNHHVTPHSSHWGNVHFHLLDGYYYHMHCNKFKFCPLFVQSFAILLSFDAEILAVIFTIFRIGILSRRMFVLLVINFSVTSSVQITDIYLLNHSELFTNKFVYTMFILLLGHSYLKVLVKVADNLAGSPSTGRSYS